MSDRTHDKIEYGFLGRLLTKVRPDIAKELVAYYYSEQPQPLERDLSKITEYFLLYCRLEKLDPEQYIGNLYKSSLVDVRRYFIAAMLHMYRPKFFYSLHGPERYRDGLSRKLADILEMDQSFVNKTIKQIVVWQKCDETFKARVEGIVLQLKQEEN